MRIRQDTCSHNPLQFGEDSTRYLQSQNSNLTRTRKAACSRTLLQFVEDSTRYLEYHSFIIWWGLDKIPGVSLCYNLMMTRQETSYRTRLQFDEDSTRYLQYHSVTIWWLDKIPAVSITIEIGYCFAFTTNVSRNFGPVTDLPVKQIPRYYTIFIQQLTLI
jgi:hypothetical protein